MPIQRGGVARRGDGAGGADDVQVRDGGRAVRRLEGRRAHPRQYSVSELERLLY